MPKELTDEESELLPILHIEGILDREGLYIEWYAPCRRCAGKKTDPVGDYPCLLCGGAGHERIPGAFKRVCAKHPDTELEYIGRRHYDWEDGQGFDHSGYLGVQGCPICKIPAYSVR